ncbi:MAG: hypothetical protein OXU23_27615 [Candidatus Poribacteria bacterium]|nr:hypothetical protein [Candidatus Poribacteria bacterium]
MSNVHLRVYANRSELVHPDKIEIFFEGTPSNEAKRRYRKIANALQEGFLVKQIELCQNGSVSELVFQKIKQKDILLIDQLVDSLTSQVGRALIAIAIMQLCVKSIEPKQSIRLHKSGPGTHNFSWKEGISMRSLDRNYITPILREYNLLHLNRDGFMMTRSLAENYPYSVVYKAQLRGAKNEWVQLVERVENGPTEPIIALRYLITLLLNRAENFVTLVDQMLLALNTFLNKANAEDIYRTIWLHIKTSDYAARLMEIAMHSFIQALWEVGALTAGEVVPLSQMRSANKKHGNIGDVEIAYEGEIIESWDAKYGKTYLRDEIEELHDKLRYHPNVSTAGFVTSEEPDRIEEVENRIQDIESFYDVEIPLLTFYKWIQLHLDKIRNEKITNDLDIHRRWLKSYAECLGQKRRNIAPIDEPCHRWVEELDRLLKKAF